MNRELETAAAEAASRVTYTGSGVSLAAWMMQIDWAMWTGIVIGVVGLLINWHYKRREDKRAEESHRLWKEKIQQGDIYEQQD